ncbi:MAG: molecular chaperone HtpG [Proteobacteria bacterium]|nr:molecular chaperone HtpG [Pseudomonadota bacterium]
MTEKRMEFKTETTQLLDLMIHSLYSHKEIFLRELISNASDAIDKARFESLTDTAISEDGGEGGFKIKISIDKEAGTLSIADNGIGMTRDEAITELGTIAHSGTKEFIEALKESKGKESPELIGQFGVGFYSTFLVADTVTVLSRKAGADSKSGIKWESTADGSFSIDDIEKETKGTEIILHIKEDEKGYLDDYEVRGLVKKYSDFIEHPIAMDVEKEVDSKEAEGKEAEGEKVKVTEEETLNSQKALWLKSKSEIEPSEYNEFYKHISHDYTDPSDTIHYNVEGTSEFTSLLFVPATRPVDILYKEYQMGLTLYVKRVKILEHCEKLLPQYLRFLKGVVDSSDLPLNVSREMLQNNSQVDVIKNSITKKALGRFKELKDKEYDRYVKFYKEYGRLLKEGLHFDFERREAITDLLLFASTKTEGDSLRSFEQYVGDMGEGQEEIFYITATTIEEAKNSPYLEVFNEKGLEVLILLDDIDDMIMGGVEFKGKKLKSVIKGDLNVDKEETEEKKELEEKFKGLIGSVAETLKENIGGVRVSSRLKDSPCCLVPDEGAMDPNMERMLKSMGQDIPEHKKTLEINATHPLLEKMAALQEADAESELLKEYTEVLYDQALLLEGSKPKDSTAFVNRVAKIMAGSAVEPS